jgi:hypothetical protein
MNRFFDGVIFPAREKKNDKQLANNYLFNFNSL